MKFAGRLVVTLVPDTLNTLELLFIILKRFPEVNVVPVAFIANKSPVVIEPELKYAPVPEVSELAVKANAPDVPDVVATELAKV